MPKFMIGGTVTVSCYTEVEANTIEEAKAEADNRDLASLCFSPFTSDVDESWHFDNDGTPTITDGEIITEDR